MFLLFKTICDKCNANVLIFENEMGIIGGKDTEQVECPQCKNVVYEGMTNGRFEVTLIK